MKTIRYVPAPSLVSMPQIILPSGAVVSLHSFDLRADPYDNRTRAKLTLEELNALGQELVRRYLAHDALTALLPYAQSRVEDMEATAHDSHWHKADRLLCRAQALVRSQRPSP